MGVAALLYWLRLVMLLQWRSGPVPAVECIFNLRWDGRPVGLDRLDAEIEDGCGLLVAVALGNQLHHRALACGQWTIVALGQERLPQRLGNHAREERLVLRDRLDSRQKQAVGLGFQHIAQGTRLQQITDQARCYRAW